MVGADVVICDLFEGFFRAVDYYINARAQCSNGDGVCPDAAFAGFTDDATDVSGERGAGVSVIRYKRPLIPTDADGAMVLGSRVDLPISANPGEETFVAWAIGERSADTGFPSFHTIAFPKQSKSIDFGRDVVDNCQPLVTDDSDPTDPAVFEKPFQRPALKDITEFRANLGPSGGPRGATSITNGRAAWGIAWYVNDYLLPVIELQRGTTYTFLVNGGDYPDITSQYHPMYITSSIDGGYAQRTPAERLQEIVFAGLEITEQDKFGVQGFNVQAAGPLCNYVRTDNTPAAQMGTYDEFFASLDTTCADSIIDGAARLEFTPDESTPDLIYYKCVTHQYLGWEIRVVDSPSIPFASLVMPHAKWRTRVLSRCRNSSSVTESWLLLTSMEKKLCRGVHPKERARPEHLAHKVGEA